MTDRIKARLASKDVRKVAKHKWTKPDELPTNPEVEKVEETKTVLDEIKSWLKGE